MPEHRIGIIGTGGIARVHANGYRAVLGDLGSVVAGCDPDRARLNSFCDRHDVALRFETTDELIRSGEVDVIALLTPPAVRHEVIGPAAERGIHMLVEKPFGECLGDAISFLDAAEDGGARIAVNHELRFMPDALRTHELVTAGAIGDVRFIAHDQFQNRTTVGGWRATEKRLEISIFSIHLLDKLRWIAGKPPVSVVCPTRRGIGSRPMRRGMDGRSSSLRTTGCRKTGHLCRLLSCPRCRTKRSPRHSPGSTKT